jgi:hypothetical protein
MTKHDSWRDDERVWVSELVAITAIMLAAVFLLTFLQG